MFNHRNGFVTEHYTSGNNCWMTFHERVLKAGDGDAVCPVTEGTRRFNELLDSGITHFDLDLSELRDIDESGYGLLRRLQERASVTLLLPEDEALIEPLALAILLFTRFDWKFLRRAA